MRLSCDEVAGKLERLLDDELAPAEIRAVEGHLAGCAGCSAERRALLRLQSDLRSLPRHDMPSDLATRIEADFAAGPSSRWGWRPSLANLAWGGGGAVAGVLVAVGLTLVSGQPTGSDGSMLLDAHLRALQHGQPVDVVSDDRHVVRPWFAGRIGVSPPVTDYAAEGFRLLGGRVDIVDGAPAAALAYQRRAHVISLFVRPAGSVKPAPAEESRQGYAVLHWNEGDLAFDLVSDLNPAELGLLKELLSRGGPETRGTGSG